MILHDLQFKLHLPKEGEMAALVSLIKPEITKLWKETLARDIWIRSSKKPATTVREFAPSPAASGSLYRKEAQQEQLCPGTQLLICRCSLWAISFLTGYVFHLLPRCTVQVKYVLTLEWHITIISNRHCRHHSTLTASNAPRLHLRLALSLRGLTKIKRLADWKEILDYTSGKTSLRQEAKCFLWATHLQGFL